MTPVAIKTVCNAEGHAMRPTYQPPPSFRSLNYSGAVPWSSYAPPHFGVIKLLESEGKGQSDLRVQTME